MGEIIFYIIILLIHGEITVMKFRAHFLDPELHFLYLAL